jgi:hypothetical protein
MARSFTDRMIGAAKLDVHVYEEVEADTSAMGQAMAVVVLHALAAGIGSIGTGGMIGIVGSIIASLIGWFIWAFVIYLIGTKLLPEPQTRSDMGELLRTIGFAASPGLLLVLGAIPLLGMLISFAVRVWMLVTMVIAVRQALDYKSTGRAIGVCVLGWVAYVIFAIVVVGMLAVMGVITAG